MSASAFWLLTCGPPVVTDPPSSSTPGAAAPATFSASPPSPTPAAESFEVLRLGELRRGDLPVGGSHRYPLELRAGEAALFEADQEEVDLEAAVFDPSGRQLLIFDSYAGQDAPERVCFVATEDGPHTVVLRPFEDAGGGYTVGLLRRRSATLADRACAEAMRVFLAAEEWRTAGPLSSALAAEYERAHDLWLDAGESLHAALAMREAGFLSLRLGRGAEAVGRYVRALGAARAAGATFLEVSLDNRLGLALLDKGDLGEAREALAQALTKARQANDQRGEANALHNLARVDEAVGEIHRAISGYRQILPIWSELGDDVGRGQTLISLADAWAQLDHHLEALHLLADAEAIFRRLGQEDRLASTLVSTGWVHYLRGRSEQAIAPFQEALALYRRNGSDDGEAAVLDRLGTTLLAIGDFAAALDAYRRSLAISEETGSSKDAANTLANIGCLYQEQFRSEEARTYLADARLRFLALDDPKGASHVEYCWARVERDVGDFEAALEHVASALAIVDGLRAAARRRGARYRPIWLWQDYSELQIELLMAQFRQIGEKRFAVQAFEASDLARARNLFELVLESQAGVRETAGGELLARERRVQEQLNAAQARRRTFEAVSAPELGGPDAELAALERRLGELSLELEEARAAIRAADSRFAEMARPQPVSLAKMQSLLDPQTVLLSYALGTERSYLFVVGRDAFTPWPLAGRRRLEAPAKALYEGLRRSRFNSYQHVLTAGELGELLLPEGAIPADTRRLLVLADGLLHYVPMAVLPLPGGDSGASRRRLLDVFDIAYLPSAAVFAALVGRDAARPPAPDTVAIFADAVFSDSDSRLQGNAARAGDAALARPLGVQRLPKGPLPRLPHTRTEADNILDLAPASRRLALFGFDATKRRVLAGELDRYRILHFATHALIDERFPELSGLVLSRRDSQGHLVDGDLHLHEIYGLNLAADLVVLSGCQTALGQRVRGDGLVSLTRGFLYAGSSQLLVSLWSVDDEATAAMMAEFYRGMLEQGRAPAAALRSAQLQMQRQERWQAPYFWAGFVLQGAGRQN